MAGLRIDHDGMEAIIIITWPMGTIALVYLEKH